MSAQRFLRKYGYGKMICEGKTLQHPKFPHWGGISLCLFYRALVQGDAPHRKEIHEQTGNAAYHVSMVNPIRSDVIRL